MEMQVYKGQLITDSLYRMIYRCRNEQCPEYNKNIERDVSIQSDADMA